MEATELLESKERIVFDDLEQTLIDETNDATEQKELKTKILNAKIKRIEKVLEKITILVPQNVTFGKERILKFVTIVEV